MSKEPIPFQEVYEWALMLSAEQRTLEPKNYLASSEAMNLLRRLKFVAKGQLIAVIGNQGTGKTVLRDQLSIKLQDDGVLNLKWAGKDPVESAFEKEGFRGTDKYIEMIVEAFRDHVAGREDFEIKAAKILELDSGSAVYHALNRWGIREFQDGNLWQVRNLIPEMEVKLGRTRLAELRKGYLLNEIAEKKHILVDFPDYDKHQRGQMIRDLKTFQEWWESLVSGELGVYQQEANVVIFFQKELWGGHFLFGKYSIFELKPFKARDLADYYEKRFDSPCPFTCEALELLARLGRGVFRWFKKYIGICLDHYYDLNGKGEALEEIGVQQVNEWITLDYLIDDWERELMDLFPKSKDLRKKAVIVLRYVAENGTVPQPQIIANIFDGAEMTASRVLNALEGGNYIERGYDGRQKIVKIARARRMVL